MDTIAQHLSGFSSLLGYYDDDGPPIRSQSSVADYFAAFSALASSLAALRHREVHGASGQKIDVSLLKALCHHVDGAFEIYNNLGEVPEPGGRNAYSPPDMLYGAARANDGWVCVALPLWSDRVWDAYCDLLDRPDLRENEKYESTAGRTDDAARLSAIFEEWLAERPVAEAVDTLNDAGIPAAKQNDIGEAANLEHIVAREVFQTIDHPRFQELTLTSSPLSLSDTGTAPMEHAPELGGDARAVLGDVGYDDAEIEALAEDGVI
jgi:formyl-CoA transferase